MEIDENNIEYLRENAINLKKALFKFDDMMKNLNITYALIYGTLLGAYRNNCLLPWDHDIDVRVIVGSNSQCTSFDDFDPFKILRIAKEYGFMNPRFGHFFILDKGFIPDNDFIKYPEIAALPIDEQWKAFIKKDSDWKNHRFDMNYSKNNIIECFLAIENINLAYSETFSNDKLETIKLYGREFYTPYNIEHHLNIHYGSTWKNIFTSKSLWYKYSEIIKTGEVPKEVEEFMEEVKSANLLVKY